MWPRARACSCIVSILCMCARFFMIILCYALWARKKRLTELNISTCVRWKVFSILLLYGFFFHGKHKFKCKHIIHNHFVFECLCWTHTIIMNWKENEVSRAPTYILFSSNVVLICLHVVFVALYLIFFSSLFLGIILR